MARRFKPRRAFRKKQAKNPSQKSKVSKAIKTYVKRAIHGNTENKLFIYQAANQTITSVASPSTPSFLSLLPLPVQGTANNQRIGNQIKIVKAFIRGHVNLLPLNSITNPQQAPMMVKMWLCSSKTINTTSLSSTNCGTDFFETNGGSQGFQGNMLDMELTNNKDSWVVYKTKTFKLGLTAYGSQQFADNSNFNMPFYFSYGRHLRRKLKFNDTGVAPTNANMFLIFQVVNADGSSTALNSAEYHTTLRVEYEDA